MIDESINKLGINPDDRRECRAGLELTPAPSAHCALCHPRYARFSSRPECKRTSVYLPAASVKMLLMHRIVLRRHGQRSIVTGRIWRRLIGLTAGTPTSWPSFFSTRCEVQGHGWFVTIACVSGWGSTDPATPRDACCVALSAKRRGVVGWPSYRDANSNPC
jgi:hypothetical protein